MESVINIFTNYLLKNVTTIDLLKGICDQEGINYIQKEVLFNMSPKGLDSDLLRNIIVEKLTKYLFKMIKNSNKYISKLILITNQIFRLHCIINLFFKMIKKS